MGTILMIDDQPGVRQLLAEELAFQGYRVAPCCPCGQNDPDPARKKVTVEAWFCPGTVANLQSNRQIALVIWDSKADKGYQVLGLTEGVEDIALLDGLAPGVESMLPQGKKRLYIRVAKVMAFQHAPHTDQEQ